MNPDPRTRGTIDLLERGLIKGRARWIADLNEFFRNHRVRKIVFDLYARGRTRNRGFFLSRFFAWSVLPDYSVSLLCIDGSRLGSLTSEKLRGLIDEALYLVKEDELQWMWLIVVLPGDIPPWAVAFVSRYDRKELGLGVASESSGQVVVSNSPIGRSISRQLGLPRLVKSVSLEQAN